MDGNSVWQRSDGNFQRFINVRQFGAPDWQAPNQTAMWDWDWDRLIWLENLCRSVQHMDRNTVKFTDTTNKLTPSKSATYSADIKDPHFWVKDGQSLFPATYIRFKPLFHHWNPKISCFTSWWRCTVYIYTGFSWSALHTIYIYMYKHVFGSNPIQFFVITSPRFWTHPLKITIKICLELGSQNPKVDHHCSMYMTVFRLSLISIMKLVKCLRVYYHHILIIVHYIISLFKNMLVPSCFWDKCPFINHTH